MIAMVRLNVSSTFWFKIWNSDLKKLLWLKKYGTMSVLLSFLFRFKSPVETTTAVGNFQDHFLSVQTWLSIKRDLNCSGFNFQPVSVFILELFFHEIATGRKRAFCNVIVAFPFFLPKKMLCNKHPMTQTGETLLFGFNKNWKEKLNQKIWI